MVTFYQLNASLLNQIIDFFQTKHITDPKPLNGSL